MPNSKLNPVQLTVLVNLMRTAHQKEENALLDSRLVAVNRLITSDSPKIIDLSQKIIRSIDADIKLRRTVFEDMVAIVRSQASE